MRALELEKTAKLAKAKKQKLSKPSKNNPNADNNSIDVWKSTQSKIKRKKKEDKEDKYDKRNVPFSLSYFTKCLLDDHQISVYDIDLYKYEQLFQDAKRDYEFELL